MYKFWIVVTSDIHIQYQWSKGGAATSILLLEAPCLWCDGGFGGPSAVFFPKSVLRSKLGAFGSLTRQLKCTFLVSVIIFQSAMFV